MVAVSPAPALDGEEQSLSDKTTHAEVGRAQNVYRRTSAVVVLGAGEVSAFAIEDRLAVGLDADGRMREFILHGLTVKEVKAFETYYARRRR